MTNDEIQNRLLVLGYNGDWGYDYNVPGTLNRAIRQFQVDRGLTVDGIVGPQTTAALGESGPGAAAPAPDLETQVREVYPQMAWALAHPELGPLLKQALAAGWDEARFQGALLKTQWFKTTSDNERTWDRLQAEDPAQAALQLTTASDSVARLSARIGVTLPPATAQQIALNAARSGWNEDRIVSSITQQATFTGDQNAGGDLGAAMDQIKSKADQYMVPISDATAWELGRDMINGKQDLAGIEATFKDQAKSRWTGFADTIDRGFTPQQIFAPYIQQTAQLLEISPSQVNLADPKYNQMIDMFDETGTRRPMSLSEAGRFVRGLHEYRSTDNAMNEAANTAEFITQRFGAVA